MLDWVLVPDAVHAQTMKQVETSELVIYGTVYEEIYEKYADSVKDTIYDDIPTSITNLSRSFMTRFTLNTIVTNTPTRWLGLPRPNLDILEEIAKAAEESGMSVDDYIAKYSKISTTGSNPRGYLKGQLSKSPKSIAESATESQIDSYVNTLIRGTETYVIDYGTIDTYTREKIDELIDEMVYEIIDNDPIYIAKG